MEETKEGVFPAFRLFRTTLLAFGLPLTDLNDGPQIQTSIPWKELVAPHLIEILYIDDDMDK
ncbi:hypothetical protein G4B88_021446 [Cannabis sativa]|uniref:Uncharacterized protein n=1 Tax=Cannabis sativa TaxID=3483 RepID=A0A7J6DNN8_CANSA|nr:hypothetical protein G4B88_021446 [Cannabis sativa]